MSEPKDFNEPIDVPDAEARLSILNLEVQRIQDQLDDEGRRIGMSLADYSVWRARADQAMSHKMIEMAWLRAYLRRHGAMAMPQSVTALGELLLAVERAMPVIVEGLPPVNHPVIRDLYQIFGNITGSYG